MIRLQMYKGDRCTASLTENDAMIPVFNKLMPMGIISLDNLLNHEAARILDYTIYELIVNKDKYMPPHPSKRWIVDWSIDFLQCIHFKCKEEPDFLIKVTI